MADIKTRDSLRGSVKTLDKVSAGTHRVKQAYIATKDKAENSMSAQESSAEEYASNKISDSVNTLTHKSVEITEKSVSKGVSTVKDKVQNQIQNRYRTNHKSIRTAENTAKDIKHTARSAGNKTVKTAQRGTVKTARTSIKTAEQTSKTAVKTAQKTAETAKKTAQASAKAAQKAAQAAKATAQATVRAAKIAAKAIVAAIKAIIAGIKALATAIAAGGWVAVVIIVVICLIALILCSVFGIFASGEDSGTGMTVRTAVQEINNEYSGRIEQIKSDNPHEEFTMAGTKAKWKEVIAIYAVDTNMPAISPANPDEAQEVATMTISKQEKLRTIFWEMNSLSHTTDTITETETVTETLDDGSTREVEREVQKTLLKVTVSHTDIVTIMNTKGFTETQKDMVYQLLSEEYNTLWFDVLYGISSDDSIVQVAIEQLGNVGGQPYWSWYGFGSRVEWCACFVSWCANECGYIDADIVPKYALCDDGVNRFKAKGQWIDGSEEPMPGMIIFFDWAYDGLDGSSDHTGIVEKIENGRVYTIEGNSGDACVENSYPIGYQEILGYGGPEY